MEAAWMAVRVALAAPREERGSERAEPIHDAMQGFMAEKWLCTVYLVCIVYLAYIVYLSFASARIIVQKGCKVVQGCWVSWDGLHIDHVVFPTQRTEDRTIVVRSRGCFFIACFG
jgi:hypothetical protein